MLVAGEVLVVVGGVLGARDASGSRDAFGAGEVLGGGEVLRSFQGSGCTYVDTYLCAYVLYIQLPWNSYGTMGINCTSLELDSSYEVTYFL